MTDVEAAEEPGSTIGEATGRETAVRGVEWSLCNQVPHLGMAEAETIRDALAAGLALLADLPAGDAAVRAQWPFAEGKGDDADARDDELTDERHWPAGVHAGLRRIMMGSIPRPAPAPAAAEAAA